MFSRFLTKRPSGIDAPDASAAPLHAEWELVPGTPLQVDQVIAQCRRLVVKRAIVAAGVAAVPIPGVDWITDVAVLMKLIPEINRAFGLTHEQIERLAPDRKLVVYKAVSAGGGLLVGRLMTRDLIIKLVKKVGIRLTTQQAAKFVPVAGQAISAALTYSSLKFVCEQHIQQCAAVARELMPPAPTAPESHRRG